MSRRKSVWVLIGSWDYEGCDEPTAAFSTKEEALAALPWACKPDWSYDYRGVIEVPWRPKKQKGQPG